MYPRNAASPPTVAVGSIYLIADGTIQTSDASVRVKTAGGSWGGGAGILGYDETSGAIEYTPSQAETNGEWFIVAVYKASCTSASVTVITSTEAVAGQVSVPNTQKVDVSDKTGFKLASDGLDSVSTTGPDGVAANFRERVNQLWRRFFGKATMTDDTLTTYRDDGETPATTQTLSDDGTTQTQGEATNA